jgi:hypothetical protein
MGQTRKRPKKAPRGFLSDAHFGGTMEEPGSYEAGPVPLDRLIEQALNLSEVNVHFLTDLVRELWTQRTYWKAKYEEEVKLRAEDEAR